MDNYFVLNDCLFGYPLDLDRGRFFRLVVMAVDVTKGGDPTLIDRTVLADGNKARVATKSDYERFRVKYPGK